MLKQLLAAGDDSLPKLFVCILENITQKIHHHNCFCSYSLTFKLRDKFGLERNMQRSFVFMAFSYGFTEIIICPVDEWFEVSIPDKGFQLLVQHGSFFVDLTYSIIVIAEYMNLKK